MNHFLREAKTKTFRCAAAFAAAAALLAAGCGESQKTETEQRAVADAPAARRTTVPAPPPAAVSVPAPAPKPVPEAKPLRVEYENYDAYNREFDIRFSVPVDENEVAARLKISPETEFRVVRRYGEFFSVRAEWKPGTSYTLRIDGSLRAENGKTLGGTHVGVFSVPDRPPQLNFSSNGTFFPLNAPRMELPVHVVNPSGKILVETREAYADSAARFLRSPGNTDFSKQIFEKSFAPETRKNRNEVFALELEKIGVARRPGIYGVSVSDEGGGSWRRDSRIVVVTDLVLQAARNGNELAVALKNLSGDAPVPAAKISVWSRKNRFVSEARTDASGFVKIELPRLDDAEDFPAFVLAESGGDRTYLDLDSLSMRRQENGAPFARFGTRAYVFPERGVCRPGEKIHVFAALRDGEKRNAAGGVPAEFFVTDPSGNAFARVPAVGDEFGFYKTELSVPAFAATGTYRVSLRVPGREYDAFGFASFSVAEYVPDVIELSLKSSLEKTADSAADAGSLRMTVSGNAGYYFGAPLAAGTVSLTRSVRFADFEPKAAEFDGFSFGAVMPDSLAFTEAPGRLKTDADGNFSFAFDAPKFSRAVTQPVVVSVTASASSGQGGRAVSAGTYQEIHYADFYFGTREKSVSEDGRVFDVLALSPDEKPADLSGKKFVAELSREEWSYALSESATGALSYEWQSREVSEKRIEFDGGAAELFVPVARGGRYALKIFDDAGTLVHERDFWHWFGETGTRSENASLLSFTFDKEKYAPGETAKISFESLVSGSAVLLFGAEKIEGARLLDVRAGENVFEFPVPEDARGGSRFFSLTVSGKSGAETRRLFGVGAVPVDQARRRIFVTTSVPARVRPGEKAEVKVSLRDAAGKPVSGEVQLWAVDRGVLSLTGFRTPDAFPFFFGQTACPYAFGDGYADFYPLLTLDKKLVGGGAAALRKFLDAADESRESAVAVLDVVRVPASGEATAEIAVPKFDGAMRLMAFALGAEKVGAGEADVVVRDPVSAKTTLPRAAAFGDEFEFLAEVFNTELPEQALSWRVLRGGAEIASGSEPAVKKGGKFVVRERVSAGTAAGAVPFAIEIADASGALLAREEAVVTVRSPLAKRDRVAVARVAPGERAEFSNADEFGSVAFGTPALAVAGALSWLEEYPYGCVEQTAAAAFPLLAAKPLARAGVVPEIFEESSASKIRSALARISTMLLPDGTYSMWAGGKETWLAGTLFAYHFLLEADAAGFPLDPARRASMRRQLYRVMTDGGHALARRAYAAYLLALSGDARAAESARLLADETAAARDDFSRFLVGAALMKSGFAAAGAELISPLLEKPFWETTAARDDCLDSSVRRAGIALRILSETAPDSSAPAKLALELCGKIGEDGQWGSTQKNAWAAFGLAKFFSLGGAGTERGVVKIGGEEKPLSRAMKIPGGNAVSVENTGTRPIFVFERARGVPEKAETVSDGFAISREYLNAAGTPVTRCATGELLTVRIRVRADEPCESAVVCDLLPGGLEIEDETLATRSRVRGAADKRASGGAFVENARERRFDRFLAFGEFSSGGDEFTELTYRVRATARGKFEIPPAQIESMYDGERRAVSVPPEEERFFEVE